MSFLAIILALTIGSRLVRVLPEHLDWLLPEQSNLPDIWSFFNLALQIAWFFASAYGLITTTPLFFKALWLITLLLTIVNTSELIKAEFL